MRGLRHQIGGRRRDHDQVGLPRQPDVADVEFLGTVEQVGEDVPASERPGGKRRDELLRRLGHDHAHRRAALSQPPDQVEALIGRDAAADDEEDAVASGSRR